MERRLHERIPAYADCTLQYSDSIELHGKLWDISEGGICAVVYADAPLQVGDVCTIRFADKPNKDGDSFVISEPIVISNLTQLEGGFRIGAAFVNGISQECLQYVRILSARAILRSYSFK